MIKVLRSSAEIERAGEFLDHNNLFKHHDRLKNWDLSILYEIIVPLARTIAIIDLGCAGLAALKFLHSLGFKDVYGIDLTVTRKERFKQIAMMFKSPSLKLPFHLYTGDLTNTIFPDQRFKLATCISVIEHGVDPHKFFMEMNRIIKPEGLLFITTDYWPEKMKVRDDKRPCGLPYTIFSKEEIIQLEGIGATHGFALLHEKSAIPDPHEMHILGDIYDHTFICMVFRKILGTTW
jgi:SAM-dependent methyltransferase